MISIQQAIQTIKDHLPERRTEDRTLTESLGYYLAEKLTAPEPLPRFNNSAMDGYAVALDLNSPPKLPMKLPVIGESQAGVPYHDELQPGEAIRISTGAYVPEGTSLVVPVEDTDNGDTEVVINDIGEQYSHIRFAGEEVSAGETIAQKRDKITPPMLSWLAGFGIQQVKVFSKPKVAVLTTGQELVDFGAKLKPGQIRNTNQLYFESYLRDMGIEPVYSSQIPDSLSETKRILKEATDVADIILLSGGVSVGPHDHVKDAAESIGFERHFWKVKQKPGKPLYFASMGEKLLFGLPGNPVSTLMSTLVYVYPVINALAGNPGSNLASVPAFLDQSYTRRKAGRAQYLLVKIVRQEESGYLIEPVGHQRSHMMSGVTESDGFIVVPVGTNEVSPEKKQTVYLFPWTDSIPKYEDKGIIRWDI
ncbi:MAG: molybdopterin molybdotransferase MoeA [Candidatus Marinimicrobia bacterium]|nr:molybdopterin molybdotransferase MoeA [Candidatus Neomarinimicrobiota bacterium]MCF7829294.1 molybdopterin molybdotransferase MoeA [Candidatus Neomarinimicrobiota bacterium]MCF7880044.1 molybdopterin molybdotransferase MoeA [Candidatus Neomarinimicrobiota bacterium]